MNEITEKVLSMSFEERAVLYKRAFDSIDGKLLLEDLKIWCFGYADPSMENAEGPINDPYTTYRNCGKLSVLRHIESNINIKPKEELK